MAYQHWNPRNIFLLEYYLERVNSKGKKYTEIKQTKHESFEDAFIFATIICGNRHKIPCHIYQSDDKDKLHFVCTFYFDDITSEFKLARW